MTISNILNSTSTLNHYCQISFNLDVSALSQSPFGQGSGEIGLSGLVCNGSELSLLRCESKGNMDECDHFKDAGLRCRGIRKEIYPYVFYLLTF